MMFLRGVLEVGVGVGVVRCKWWFGEMFGIEACIDI